MDVSACRRHFFRAAEESHRRGRQRSGGGTKSQYVSAKVRSGCCIPLRPPGAPAVEPARKQRADRFFCLHQITPRK